MQELELQVKLWNKEDEAIPGIGPITASAIIATVGNATEFKNGKQLSAWFGLVPNNALAMASRYCLASANVGDTYLRTLLIHGARAVIRFAENKAEPESWLRKLITRRNKNISGEQECTYHLGATRKKHYIPCRSHYGSVHCRSLIKGAE